jgi:hypothetical protein
MKPQTPRAKSHWQAAALALALQACLAMHPARAQTPTIEELEKRIDDAKKAKAASEQAQEDSKRPAEQKTKRTAPFDELADGLLRDHRTGLIWSAADNGKDVDWVDAARYCNRRGMQLPTVGQLQKLVDHSGAMTTPCQTRQCSVSDRFHLTGYGYWSRQREGARWAIFVTLDTGRRSFDYVGIRNNYRALCVRGT